MDDGRPTSPRRGGGDGGRPAVPAAGPAVNRGKGAAVGEGVLAARGEFILFSDAEPSTPIEEADNLLARQRESAPTWSGFRALPDSRITRPQGRLRQPAGKTFSLQVRLITGLPFRDTQCVSSSSGPGARELFPGWPRSGSPSPWRSCTGRYAAGSKVLEVPVEWADYRHSRVRFFRDSTRMARPCCGSAAA